MTDYFFPAPPPASVKIAVFGKHIAINRVFCVARNYAAHAVEMGFDLEREDPFYFTKSNASIVASGSTIPYPLGTNDFHYEMELVVAIGAPGHNIEQEKALSHVFGYACGLDMTRRDLQLAARERGHPWCVSKDIENGAVIADINPAEIIGHPSEGRIWLSVNGEVRQDSDISKLIWSIPEVISHLSCLYHLAPGDLIFTGTPAGVGSVVHGDRIEGGIDSVGGISLSIQSSKT